MTWANSAFSKRALLILATVLLTFAGGGQLWAQSEVTIYSLTSVGLFPVAGGVAADSNGVIYGNSAFGGTAGQGALFQLIPPAVKGGPWTENTLYSFQGDTGGADGSAPYSTPIIDSHGVIYGTTIGGGEYGTGTIYELVPPATEGGAWTESIILSESQGYFQAGMTMDSAGNMYTVTANGTVIQLVPVSSGGWSVNYLYQLAAGSYTLRSLTVDKAGNVYGVSTNGGKYNAGYLFEIQPPFVAKGKWRESDLYDFTGGSDGGAPMSSLTLKSGVLYGTASTGGASGFGAVYTLTPPSTRGAQWTESVLYSFLGGAAGADPWGGVTFGNGGTLFGTTTGYNTTTFAGTAYKLTPPTQAGGAWTETVVHNFDGLSDGGEPMNSLLSLHGSFYGTTSSDSAVFEVMQK
jgi:uncharacterized repeat protein (TIGR03803 family)